MSVPAVPQPLGDSPSRIPMVVAKALSSSWGGRPIHFSSPSQNPCKVRTNAEAAYEQRAYRNEPYRSPVVQRLQLAVDDDDEDDEDEEEEEEVAVVPQVLQMQEEKEEQQQQPASEEVPQQCDAQTMTSPQRGNGDGAVEKKDDEKEGEAEEDGGQQQVAPPPAPIHSGEAEYAHGFAGEGQQDGSILLPSSSSSSSALSAVAASLAHGGPGVAASGPSSLFSASSVPFIFGAPGIHPPLGPSYAASMLANYGNSSSSSSYYSATPPMSWMNNPLHDQQHGHCYSHGNYGSALFQQQQQYAPPPQQQQQQQQQQQESLSSASSSQGSTRTQTFQSGASLRDMIHVKIRYFTVQFKWTTGTYIGEYDSHTVHHCPFGVGDVVVVEGDRGTNIGTITEAVRTPTTMDVHRIMRHAEPEELALLDFTRERETKASEICQANVQKLFGHGVMNVVDTEFQTDFNKLTVLYSTPSGNSHVKLDFRQLQRQLFREFRCRIWLTNADQQQAGNAQR